MDFGDRDKSYIRWRLEMVGGYDKQGNVFSIAHPLTGSVSFPVKSFPDADALKQFINEFVFFRYGGCCPTWRSVLRESDCFSDEERGTGTLKGKNYTPEGGKNYVIELISLGKLVVHRTGSWLQPHEGNHHLPWSKSGTKKEEFLPPSQTTTLGPHEEPGYVPNTSGDRSTTEDESVVSNGNRTVISSEMEEKILLGQRVVNENGVPANRIRGGHSPEINNSNSNFAVEALQSNSDGTQVIKFLTQFPDGNLSKEWKLNSLCI